MDRRLAILGSTGSIGRQCLEALAELPGVKAVGLAAGGNRRLLVEQACALRPEAIALADADLADGLADDLPAGVATLAGPDAMCKLIDRTRPDVVLTAVVGSAGLAPTLRAIEAGATLALANKETLVCAGAIVMPAARAARIDVLPVDSEHSGIFQCMQAGQRKEVRRVLITSSGGSLRDWPDDKAQTATVDEALNHPTWSMGRKITIDSATLMNKALEVIEAHWLFDLSPEQIEVVIHPQSIVHAMVEFTDGSTIAQLARPDMKGPIAYALTYPERPPVRMESIDWTTIGQLEFRPVTGRFRQAVDLAYRVIRHGGASGAVLNAANEAAVDAFLNGLADQDDPVAFGRIVETVDAVLTEWLDSPDFANRSADEQVQLEDLMTADAWARRRTGQLLAETADSDS